MAINWLEEVKADAEKITAKRLAEDAEKFGFDFAADRKALLDGAAQVSEEPAVDPKSK